MKIAMTFPVKVFFRKLKTCAMLCFLLTSQFSHLIYIFTSCLFVKSANNTFCAKISTDIVQHVEF